MAGILRSCGVRDNRYWVTFLIVGPAELCDKISQAFNRVSKQRTYRVAIHKCESVPEVLKYRPEINVDYIVFAYDDRTSHSLVQVEENIALIDKHYILHGRCCLVHCNGVPNVTSMMFQKSKQLCNRYNLRTVSCKVSNESSCDLLADSILNLAEFVLGVNNGIPVVDVKTKH